MEAEGGQGFPHGCHRAAFRGHGGYEPTVNSTVEEPHPRRKRRFIHTKNEEKGGSIKKFRFYISMSETSQAASRTTKRKDGRCRWDKGSERTYPKCFRTGPPVMRMNWYLDPYTYAVSMVDLCSSRNRY